MAARKRNIDWLMKNISSPNLVDEFNKIDPQIVTKIATRVINGYDIDETSRSEWKTKTEEGLKVAKQITEEKTFPWKGAANVKYPLIAIASIQFAARSYPQIVNGTDIVKAQVVGEDPQGVKQDRAKRISQHMSWQCLDQMPEWEPDMDQLLHGVPVVGSYFKKTFFDPLIERNRSICCTPIDIVVNMKHKGDLTTCRRISHRLFLYKNEVIERANAGIYVEDAHTFMTNQTNEDESPQELFIEQHMWYDADGDGYEEPYISTVHYESQKVVRIVANYDESTIKIKDTKEEVKKIDKIEYFTKYSFIPSPDGDFYDIGFAHLLGPINEAMSTLINQLLDSGSLSNMQSGFISKGLRWGGGRLEFDLGEWKPVDTVGMSLKDAVFPLPVREPSQVLFQLLGLLNEAGQKLASVSDAMSGDMPSQNTPATTTLAMIEQGLKVFTAIYKRLYRSMKSEYKKMYRLNSLYMDETEYFRVLDTQHAIKRVDYAMFDMDVVPVADPNMASEAQRLATANALLGTMEMNPLPSGKAEILRQYYEAIGAKNIDKLLNMEELVSMMEGQPPPPEVLAHQLAVQKAQDDFELKLKDQEIRENEAIARIQNIEADTNLKIVQGMKTLAEAEAVEPGIQLQQYKAYLSDLAQQQQHERELMKLNMETEMDEEESENGGSGKERTVGSDAGENAEGAAPGMAPQPNDLGGIGGSPLPAGPPQGAAGGGINLDAELSGTNGDANYSAIGADLRSQSNSGNLG